MEENINRAAGKAQFEKARRQANREQLAARLTGRGTHSLPFEAIRSELRQQNPFYRGLQNVELEAIVGSVGRYQEFTRQFLPLNDGLADRWVTVDALAQKGGWPPVELYQVGNIYFVKDGNHRVSVARYVNNETIEAHVWAYPIDVAIDPTDKLDDVLIQLGEKRFMEQTQLDQQHPDHNLHFTAPGRYSELLIQIADWQQKLAVIDQTEIPYAEAVDAWYEMVYLPTIQIIRDSALLDEFPGRTEADLFVWLSKHREPLREIYGEYENLAELVELLIKHYGESGLRKVTRQVRRLLGQDDLPELVEADTTQTNE
jgi:hypothetical protein